MKSIQVIIKTTTLCLFLFLYGCVPVNPKPFQDYEISTRRLQEGMETVFLIDRKMTTEGFIQQLIEGNEGAINSLRISFPGECEFQTSEASNISEQKKKIHEFKLEFESQKEECVILVVHLKNNLKTWAIAGFNNEHEFNSIVIDDPNSELSIEFQKKPANEIKIVELITAKLNRTNPNPFGLIFSGNPPLFITIAQSERIMGNLNRGFSDYAALLVMLAGSEIVNQELFDKMTKDLNGNINDTASQLREQGVKLPENINQGIGIFSTAAVVGFQAYIEDKRRASLKEAVEENKQVIEEWSFVAMSALRNIRDDVQNEYDGKKVVLGKALIKGVNESVKRKAAQDLIQLTVSMFDIMGVLQKLDSAYSNMPKAHADLADSLSSDTFSLPNLKSYYDQARHLQDLYKSMIVQP